MKRRSAEIRRHWDRLREMGCIVTGRPDPTIHHCHGGSMRDLGIQKGIGLKTSDWLVIPLAAELHSIGPNAIDGAMGVKDWEYLYGSQVEYIDEVCRRIGIDVWVNAGIERCIDI
jgi:hypothetical protein